MEHFLVRLQTNTFKNISHKKSPIKKKFNLAEQKCFYSIQLLESPIPTAAPAPAVSQKASSDDISGTKRGTIDPLVSKRPGKIQNKKKELSKMVKIVKMF